MIAGVSIAAVAVWAFMVIVLTVLAAWAVMLGLMANMDRGGIHPVLGFIGAMFGTADVALMIYGIHHFL